MKDAMHHNPPNVPSPFLATFDADDGSCLCCGGSLDTGWACNDCGADHFLGVQLLLDTTQAARQ